MIYGKRNVERALGSISGALSSPVYIPPRVRGRSAGSFPEQLLVIEPIVAGAWQDEEKRYRRGRERYHSRNALSLMPFLACVHMIIDVPTNRAHVSWHPEMSTSTQITILTIITSFSHKNSYSYWTVTTRRYLIATTIICSLFTLNWILIPQVILQRSYLYLNVVF